MKTIGYAIMQALACVLRFIGVVIYLVVSLIVLMFEWLIWKVLSPRGERSEPLGGERDEEDDDAIDDSD